MLPKDILVVYLELSVKVLRRMLIEVDQGDSEISMG